MDQYKITFETWDKVASLYQEKFMDLELYNDTYDRFCYLIETKDPAILEIGCGPGNITKYMTSIRPDLKIKAIDVSQNMINLARTNNPGVEFQKMDCRKINTLPGNFDGIICGFCIPYLSVSDSSKLILDCFRLLKTNGILYFSTIKGDYTNSGFKSASTGDQSYVYYYDEDHFKNELIINGYELIDLLEKTFPINDATAEVNQIFIARKC
ncbi:MAG: class I SAM-dependent methyltransferase [Ferruginibacter sp.]